MRPIKSALRGIVRQARRLRDRRAELSADEQSPADPAGTGEPTGTGKEIATSETVVTETTDRQHPEVRRRHPAEAVPWAMRAAAAWSWRLLLVGAVVTGLLYLLWMFRLVTFPIFVALLLTALLQPAVAWLRRRGTPRSLATVVVFVCGISAVGAIVYGLTELILAGLDDLGAAVTAGIEQVRRWLEQLGFAQINQLTNRIQQWIQQNIQRISRGAITTVTVVGRLLAGLFLTLIVTFFFLYDGSRIWAWIVKLFPRSVEDRVDGAGRRAWHTLVGYVQGTVIVALFDAVLITILLYFVGLPVSLIVPLGVLVFFAAFVPLLGALASGIVAVLVTLVTQGLVAALIVLGGVIAVQQIEGNVLQPFVLGHMVRLHPLAVLLAVSAGAIVAGVVGAIVAVPLAAVINITCAYFFRRSDARTAPHEDTAR